MKHALVAGGQASFVQEKLSKSLARHGITIHTHWSWDKKRPPTKFPDHIDLIYICTDMIGHSLANPCVEYARDSGIPFVNGTRKWAESIERLTQAGFPLQDPVKNLPAIITEAVRGLTQKQLAEEPTAQEIQSLLTAVTGTAVPSERSAILMEKFYVNPTVRAVSADLVEQLDQHTQPIIQETPVSENTDKPKNHLVVSNPTQQVYLRALIIDPCISNNSLWDRIKGDPLLIGKKFDAQRSSQARTQLGITVERREMQRRVHINTAQFVAVAHGIGMKGYAVPQSFYSFPDAGQGSQPRAKAEETPSVTAAPPAPAPSAAPTPGPIPAPVVTPGRVKPADPMAELKDLLSLVKIAMKELNIVDLHVTPDSVKFKQVTVLEGELAV